MNFDVTHVIPYMHPRSGGPPVVVDRCCRRLAARGWSVRVVTTDALAGEDRTDWTAAYRDGYPLEVYSAGGLGSFAYSRSLGRDMGRIVESSRLVHVHTAWTHPGLAAMTACRRRSVPFVVMPHGMLDPFSLRRKWLKKQLYGRACEWPNMRRAAAMIYTHDNERRLAEHAVPRLPRGWIVPLGTDEPPAESRESLAADFFHQYPELRGRKLVVFLSRLHSKKGLDLLIPAFREVVRRIPAAHLLLVGSGTPQYTGRLRQWIEQHGLGDHVTLAGSRTGRDKWSALAAGEVFALPSYQENFGLVLVEAMRMGLPLVLTRRVNIWPEIEAAGAGVCCELNTARVAAAICQLLEDQENRLRRSQAARRLAETEFTWGRSVDCLEEVYRHVLGEQPAVNCEPAASGGPEAAGTAVATANKVGAVRRPPRT